MRTYVRYEVVMPDVAPTPNTVPAQVDTRRDAAAYATKTNIVPPSDLPASELTEINRRVQAHEPGKPALVKGEHSYRP